MDKCEKCELNFRVGKNIKNRREELNLSLGHVAEFIGTTAGYLGLIERGKRSITTTNMIKLTDILQIEIEKLLEIQTD